MKTIKIKRRISHVIIEQKMKLKIIFKIKSISLKKTWKTNERTKMCYLKSYKTNKVKKTHKKPHIVKFQN